MVSIIIPAFNTAPYLGKCAKSLKAQNFRDWECIIVDDGSTDNTLQIANTIAEGDKRFKVIPLGANHGISMARNTALKAASGDMLFYLDSDDWIDATMLNRLTAFVAAHPFAGRYATPKIIHWKKHNWYLPWSITPLGLHSKESPHPFSNSSCDLGYGTGNIYVRRWLPDDLFFPEVVIFEDMLYNMGLLFAGVPTYVTDIQGYYYERRDDSILSCNYTQEDADIAQQVLTDLAERYNPKPELLERCRAFLTNSQNGKLGKK